MESYRWMLIVENSKESTPNGNDKCEKTENEKMERLSAKKTHGKELTKKQFSPK